MSFYGFCWAANFHQRVFTGFRKNDLEWGRRSLENLWLSPLNFACQKLGWLVGPRNRQMDMVSDTGRQSPAQSWSNFRSFLGFHISCPGQDLLLCEASLYVASGRLFLVSKGVAAVGGCKFNVAAFAVSNGALLTTVWTFSNCPRLCGCLCQWTWWRTHLLVIFPGFKVIFQQFQIAREVRVCICWSERKSGLPLLEMASSSRLRSVWLVFRTFRSTAASHI